jgi:hypothetical protein
MFSLLLFNSAAVLVVRRLRVAEVEEEERSGIPA